VQPNKPLNKFGPPQAPGFNRPSLDKDKEAQKKSVGPKTIIPIIFNTKMSGCPSPKNRSNICPWVGLGTLFNWTFFVI